MNIKLTDVSHNDNWIKGIVDNGEYCFEAKVYDEDSKYGINGGKISKLSVSEGSKFSWEDCFANYDRDWDIEPETNYESDVVIAIVNYLEAL